MYQNMFAINRESSESLQKQIRRQIAIAIVNRQLPLHQPLPSIRKLATQLNVSVNTMALAYEALKQDGFIDSRDRSGFYVNVDIYQEGQLDKWAHQLTPQEPEQQFDFSAFFERRSYNLPRVSKPSDCLVRYNYPFICGLVDPSLFPIASWRECIRDSVNVVELKNWAADFSRIDDPLLIEQLIQRVLSRRGLIAHPDEVLITVGGQQALYIAIKTLLGSGAKIGIEDPGYADAVNIAQMESLHIERLPVDSQGLLISEKIAHCDCIYTTPSHHFPTTVTMPSSRRRELLALTRRHGVFIIEDDYEAEISFNETPPAALKSMDNWGNVIYTGSLSKSLLPGLRIGYMVGDRHFIREAKALRHHIIRHPPVNNQRSVALFMQRGYFDRFLTKLTGEYKLRSHVMSEALNRHLPGSAIPPAFGGGSFWVELPQDIDALALQRACKRRSVWFEPAGSMFSDPVANKNHLRLGYSSIDQSLIEPGVAIIAEEVRRQRG